MWVCTCLFAALELIPEAQPSSTYLTLPPTVILWSERESLNTSCHDSEPGHPMAWWTTSLTGVTRACSWISSVRLCVTSASSGVWIKIYKRDKINPHARVLSPDAGAQLIRVDMWDQHGAQTASLTPWVDWLHVWDLRYPGSAPTTKSDGDAAKLVWRYQRKPISVNIPVWTVTNAG